VRGGPDSCQAAPAVVTWYARLGSSNKLLQKFLHVNAGCNEHASSLDLGIETRGAAWKNTANASVDAYSMNIHCEDSPFVMLRLTQAPQAGSAVRVVYGNYIYAGVVTDVHWNYDFAYARGCADAKA
jgi:hypothetical protein